MVYLVRPIDGMTIEHLEANNDTYPNAAQDVKRCRTFLPFVRAAHQLTYFDSKKETAYLGFTSSSTFC